MCGIAGIVATEAGRYAPAVQRMVAALRHRGPDGEGMHTASSCVLGHTRLSVVDPAGGVQPMTSGPATLVFNGEIYGYRTLRHTLTGFPFRTDCDTEVLLALYERDGVELLDELPGMFAFALWDEQRQQLFCARDRFGEKPFFYATTADGAFVFASELKAILASGLVEPEIDPDSVAHYLRYLYVHPHRTIYRNVHVLPPAHRLVWRAGTVRVSPYWTLPATAAIGLDAAVEEFRERLRRAVARQLVADVPVGAFLSGGLDSSTLVALAAETQGTCKTFSFGFGAAIDELPYARQIASRYRTDHYELTDGDSAIADLVTRMSGVYDEPFGDSSNIPTYLLCEQARRHVTVALTGEGADELLGGYSFWYRALFEVEEANRRDAASKALARIVGAVCRRTGLGAPDWIDRTNRGGVLGRSFDDVGAAHAARAAWFSEEEVAALVPGAGVDWTAMRPAAATLDEVLRSDLTKYLPGDILVKADRASMAHGLELRAPFLDLDFASFCIALPASLKITDREDKVILRRAFEDAWTTPIRGRGKQGFGAPVAEWLRRPDVAALANDLLGNPRSRLYDIVPRPTAATQWNAGQRWALLVLAVWLDAASRRGTATRFAPLRAAAGRNRDAVLR